MKDSYSVFSGDVSFTYSVSETRPEPFESDHCHEKYEILYFVDASGSYIVEGVEYNIHPGALMLINPFAYHHVELDPLSRYEAYSLLFQKNALSSGALRLFEKIIDGGECSGQSLRSVEIGEDLMAVLERFKVGSSLPEEEMAIYIEALLSEVIVLLSVAERESFTYPDDCLGAHVMLYLNNNIERNISLDSLAKRFFVSKYHLCRAFKVYSGISVHSYINHKRIMYARQLIESGETASGAAEQVGFGDYSAFYRAYIRIVGKSPTADSK